MTETAIPATVVAETANDRFKRSWVDWFWASMIAATILHFSVFALWPDLTAEDVSFTASDLESIELPPEIEIPPPPQKISRPATPVVSTAEIDEDITIAPTTFEDNPVEDLPPPPEEQGSDISAAPVFTPMTVRPEIKNVPEVIRAMEREYPPILRDAGIGGRVVVWFFIDEEGRVQDFRISTSSGHSALDDAAIKVASVYRFTPALNRDQKVKVWVQFPITFEVR
jgi:periplasmic protein TonB